MTPLVVQQHLVRWARYISMGLVFLLPLHGALSVFLPPAFRFWKEVFLGILLLIVVGIELWGTPKKLSLLEGVSLFFCALVGGQVLFGSDVFLGLVAARYLVMGFVTFLIFSRLWGRVSDRFLWRQCLLTALILASVLSVLFGMWAQFFGGFDILRDFYSSTISSWVPGQTLPLYHQAGESIRMQGMSSGPIAFSHILVCSLFGLLLVRGSRWLKVFLGILLVFGVWFSLSRSAVGAVVLLGIISIFRTLNVSRRVAVSVFLGGGMVFLGGGLFLSDSFDSLWSRAGTSDHITRPVEAFSNGIQKPFVGHFSQAGPAARMRNMQEHNTDQAFIAENVFADYFYQLGVGGLLLGLAFWGIAFWRSSFEGRLWAVISFLLMQWATIFDMIPVSVLFFLLFVVCIGTSKKSPL